MFEWIQQLFQSLSMFHVLGILFIVILILYYIYTHRDPNNMDVLPTLTPLNVRKDIVTSDVAQQMIVGSGGSTVMGFFSLQAGNRTTTYNNNFVPLMQVDNNWWLEISNTNIDDVSARLRVKTSKNGTSSITKDETIPLPSIPKQKWVCIAILREGRRFDVIYDNRIVASHHLDQYPVVITSPLSIGSKGLDGKVIHVIINKTRLTPSDIERQRLMYVDTNNDILEDNYLFPSFPSLKLFAECPSGLPCDPITKAPLDNMYSWTTPYA